MKTLLHNVWHEFWYSEEKARLWLRSLLGFVALAAAQLDFSHLPTDARGWAGKLAVAMIAAIALGTKAGDRNPPAP